MRHERFYCDACGAWTRLDPAEPSPTCNRCGEAFTCGECGYGIDAAGTCQRPVELGVCPEAATATVTRPLPMRPHPFVRPLDPPEGRRCRECGFSDSNPIHVT